MKNAGVIVGAVIFLYSLVMLWQSFSMVYYTSFGPGPGFFPLWLSIILMILSLLYIWESIKKEVFLFSEILPKGRELGNILTVLLSVVIFMILVNYTGFIIAGSILLFMVLRKGYKAYQAFGIAIGITLALHYVFNVLLEVPLPTNAFGW